MMTSCTLVAEDFSALGQISMVAALNVLQAFDIETAALPTTLLSTQTEGFKTPVRLATNDWLTSAIGHWQSIPDLQFKGALIGYLGSIDLMQRLSSLLKNVASPVLIDPVMADHGALYPGLSGDYAAQMRTFCQQADVITPNWTELCLLAGHNKPLTATLTAFKQMVGEVRSNGIDAQVVATGVHLDGQEQTLVTDRDDDVQMIAVNHYPGHFFGAGDTFAALLMANLLTGHDLYSAVQNSCDQLEIAIQETSSYPAERRRYGLKLGKLLAAISKS